ncbi:hypothetical protein [Nocardia farcinica]|uniref:hypothetical protein n=1 Tax=Nocardia farcinica TaxID=37329 RepID=UPI002458054F|nr:hypothetical protein [Nocardia farcinica]
MALFGDLNTSADGDPPEVPEWSAPIVADMYWSGPDVRTATYSAGKNPVEVLVVRIPPEVRGLVLPFRRVHTDVDNVVENRS